MCVCVWVCVCVCARARARVLCAGVDVEFNSRICSVAHVEYSSGAHSKGARRISRQIQVCCRGCGSTVCVCVYMHRNVLVVRTRKVHDEFPAKFRCVAGGWCEFDVI